MTVTGEYIFAEPGEKVFKVDSNYYGFLELGIPEENDYHLLARIQQNQFLISGDFFCPFDNNYYHVIDNVPMSPNCRKEITDFGYLIINNIGKVIIGINVRDDICIILGTLYNSKGDIVAQSKQDDFIVLQGSMLLGRSKVLSSSNMNNRF